MPCSLCGQDGHNRRTCMNHHPTLTHPEITLGDWTALWKDNVYLGVDYLDYLNRKNRENYRNPMTDHEKSSYFYHLHFHPPEAKELLDSIHLRNQPAPQQDEEMPPPQPDTVEANHQSQPDTQTEEQLLPSTDRDAIIAARLQAREYRVVVAVNRPRDMNRHSFRNYDNRTGHTVNVYWATSDSFLPKFTISVNPFGRTSRSHFRLRSGTILYFSFAPLDPNISVKENPNKRHVFQTTMFESPSHTIVIKRPETSLKKWKHTAIKLNYLMEQLKRMGIENEKMYPNLAPIADMHQDIEMPEISESDKHQAGIPSAFDV